MAPMLSKPFPYHLPTDISRYSNTYTSPRLINAKKKEEKGKDIYTDRINRSPGRAVQQRYWERARQRTQNTRDRMKSIYMHSNMSWHVLLYTHIHIYIYTYTHIF